MKTAELTRAQRIATGWDAPDAEMVEVAERFYRELASGLPVGEALHRTKLAIRAEGRPSREWAAFRLTGDPFLMVPLRRPRPAWWPIITAAVLLAAGGLIASRRRAEPAGQP